ncbi:MAG: type I glyceraldehyde-3-phosphate dehydrogenase [Candidatus Pacebacteria bacterium]|nr:type I glyceraldehyde-3-phosphate dehydrogenase [Candidatus Paceibacterota bacterium]
MAKIAINGFGRIGRQVFKILLEKYPNLSIVAINDLTDTKTLAHLLNYDSLYGMYTKRASGKNDELLINGYRFKVYTKKDPSKIPWKEAGAEIILECTGFFTDYNNAKKHIEGGAKKVIISAPSKSKEIPMFILGVNEEKYNPKKDNIISNASCTTNCLAPVVKVLNENFKIEEGFMTTTHSYTNDQKILDLPHKDLRRARAAALSIIPTTTGAAKSISKVIPSLEGKLDGIALRIPTPTVSIVDFICRVKNPPKSAEEVNYIFKQATKEKRLQGILGIEDAELVSVDYKGNSFSAVVDANLTMVNKSLIKIVVWYDNEWGYSTRLADITNYIAEKL